MKMKRKIALILALCMIFPLFSSCGVNYNADEMMSEYKPPNVGKYGGEVPYLSDLKLDIELIDKYAPDKAGALAIAKKYYDMCKPQIDNFMLSDYIFIVTWTPDFTGKHSDSFRASNLSMVSALLQRQTDAAYFYTTVNAAVFELDPEGAAGALNFAAAIATCGEDLQNQGVNGIDRYEFNADALLMYCHALRICEWYEGTHVITALTGMAGVLYDMDELTACQTVLERVVELDKECCEAFDMLFNLYMETNQTSKAVALFRKSPTYPMAAGLQKTIDEVTEEAKKLSDLPLVPQTEADIEAIAKAIETARNISIADYYENIGIEQEARLEIQRHVEQMRSKMVGANPPDMQYILQFGQYDAYHNYVHNGGPQVGDTLMPWEERSNFLNRRVGESYLLYVEKMQNLATIAQNADDYLNPNDITLQIMLVTRANNLMNQLIPITAINKTTTELYEMNRIADQKINEIFEKYSPISREAEKKYGIDSDAVREITRQLYNELNTYCKGVFGSAVNMAGPKYAAVRVAIIKSYPAIMTNIMMISDPDVQLFLLTRFDSIMTNVTVYGLDMLFRAYQVVPWHEPANEDTRMLDPGTADRDAMAADTRTNADFERYKAARDAFYANVIDENSEWYKRENDNYGVKMNLVLVKVEMNDFITKTSTILDLKAFSGSLNTVTNHLRGDTTWNGTLKVGLHSGKLGTASADIGAKSSFSFTTDGKGGIVPNSFQGKVGLEASVTAGKYSMSVGMGIGTDGVYAEAKAALSKFGGKVEVGIEMTTTKGIKLSSGASISNEAIKDLNRDEILAKYAKETPGWSAFEKKHKKVKVLWNGQYVVHTW